MRYIILCGLLVLSVSAGAQNQQEPPTTAPKPPTIAVPP
jgi:hypothetical protein